MLIATDGINYDGKEPWGIRVNIADTNERAGEGQTRISFIAINMDREYFRKFEKRGDRIYSANDPGEVMRSFQAYYSDMILEEEDISQISPINSNQ